MKFFLAMALVLTVFGARAQDTNRKSSDSGTVARTSISMPAQYYGGEEAWIRFLNKHLRYPEDAINNEIQGDVVVQFQVDIQGIVSDVDAISGPLKGDLRKEAMRVIRISGKWIAAVQDGVPVQSVVRKTISFKLTKG